LAVDVEAVFIGDGSTALIAHAVNAVEGASQKTENKAR
jgi:hypothetical protein